MPDKAIDSAKRTLVEDGTEFHGTMKSSCPVTVNGRIEGELTAPRLDVTESGCVVGTIKADELSSRGRLSGNIDAGELTLSGSVGSNTVIKAKKLEVRLAPSEGRMQVSFGECTLDVGDEPSKEASKPVADSASQQAGDKAPDSLKSKAEKAMAALAEKPADGKGGKSLEGKSLEGKSSEGKSSEGKGKPLEAGADAKPRTDGKEDLVPPPQPIAAGADPGAIPPVGDAKKSEGSSPSADAKS